MGCATAPPKAISQSDLAALKGNWEGERVVAVGTSALTDLEIYNDRLPLQGKMTFYSILVRGTGGRQESLAFKNGIINKEGDLMIREGDNVIELSLYGGEGKMKLDGTYFYKGFRGKLYFNKK